MIQSLQQINGIGEKKLLQIKRDIRAVSVKCNVWISVGSKQTNPEKTFLRQYGRSKYRLLYDIKELLLISLAITDTEVMFKDIYLLAMITEVFIVKLHNTWDFF